MLQGGMALCKDVTSIEIPYGTVPLLSPDTVSFLGLLTALSTGVTA